jgi:choline dehydrogenase
MNTSPDEVVVHGPHFAERVRRNQQRLGSELKAEYDFIVCGSGSSGSVVARRLAEHADVSVLLERGYARWSYVIVHTAFAPG